MYYIECPSTKKTIEAHKLGTYKTKKEAEKRASKDQRCVIIKSFAISTFGYWSVYIPATVSNGQK